jgi:outer membrane protein TolC
MVRNHSYLFFAFIVWTTAFAQTRLTLQQCVVHAEQNSPALRASEGAMRSSGLAQEELSTSGLPQLKVVAGGSYAPIPPRFGYDPAISNGGQVAGQIVVQQSLYDGGVRGLKSDQLRYESERLGKERQRINRDLLFTVRQTFIEALRAQQEVHLQQESADQLAEYLGLVRRLFNGGNASYTDVLKTDVQFSNATIVLQKSDEALATAKYSLSELIGATIDSSVGLAGSLDTLLAGESDTLANKGGHDLLTNLDLSIAGLTIEQSLLDVEVEKSKRLPELSFIGDVGYLSSVENLRLPSADRFNSFGYSVGIGIEIPLFSWGATGLRITQRELETDGLRFQRELLRRSLRTEYRKTQLQLARALDRLRAIRANITKAEENFLLTKSKFAGGVSLSLEVLSAHQLLTDAKLGELQTLADIQLFTAKLDQLSTQ